MILSQYRYDLRQLHYSKKNQIIVFFYLQSTIRKTVGDFKRTHHDNWATHQLKFTEDQLAVLSDLTIPPSYYA